jgi:hypothetical protein
VPSDTRHVNAGRREKRKMRSISVLCQTSTASLVLSLTIVTSQSWAGCPPRDSAFQELTPLRPIGCGTFNAFVNLKRAVAFSDGRSMLFVESGQTIEFSTVYSLQDHQISALSTVKGNIDEVEPPANERGPYAILDDQVGNTVFLFGRERDYQLALSRKGQKSDVSSWAALQQRIGAERQTKAWSVTGTDKRIADADRETSYAYLGPIFCHDFDFAVELPEIDRIALIAGTRWMLLSSNSSFKFEDRVIPNPGFSSWSRTLTAAADVKEFSDKRVIGSVAASSEADAVWIRVSDAMSEGSKGEDHYIKFQRSVGGHTQSFVQPSWWCLK